MPEAVAVTETPQVWETLDVVWNHLFDQFRDVPYDPETGLSADALQRERGNAMSKNRSRSHGIAIELAADTFTRKDKVAGTVKFTGKATSSGKLTIRWADGFGRTVGEVIKRFGRA